MPTRLLLSLATLCAALALPAAPAHAVVVERLYEATVPVPDQSDAARSAALRDALGAVFVRASGRLDAATIDADAARMVQQFRYETRQVTDPLTGTVTPALDLWARFDPVAVQRALVERGVPIWGRERPAVLVWLAYDDGFERALVDESAPLAFRGAALDAARARGLPLIPPLMDLQDRAALSFTDVWGGFDDSILAASRRYNADAVLVGRLYALDGERWGARWILYADGAAQHHESEAGAIEAVAADGVHWTAGLFAERFSLLPDAAPDGRTRVVVAGVDGLDDYAAAMRYLATLSPVADVAVVRVERDEVTFSLELRGTREQLEQAIGLGSQLMRAPDDLEEITGALRYTIRP